MIIRVRASLSLGRYSGIMCSNSVRRQTVLFYNSEVPMLNVIEIIFLCTSYSCFYTNLKRRYIRDTLKNGLNGVCSQMLEYFNNAGNVRLLCLVVCDYGAMNGAFYGLMSYDWGRLTLH